MTNKNNIHALKRSMTTGVITALFSVGLFCAGISGGFPVPCMIFFVALFALSLNTIFGLCFIEADRQRKRWEEIKTKNRAIEEYKQKLLEYYDIRPKNFCEEEPKQEPIRKVCGVLSEAFANLGEAAQKAFWE